MGPGLQQVQTSAVEADGNAHRHTNRVELKPDNRNAPFITDAMAATVTGGRLFAVGEKTTR